MSCDVGWRSHDAMFPSSISALDPKDQLCVTIAQHQLRQTNEQHGEGRYTPTLSCDFSSTECCIPDQCNIQLNRKVLSELAIHEPRTFAVGTTPPNMLMFLILGV